MLATTSSQREITGGIDTHTVAALDELGRQLGHANFSATTTGCEELLDWLTDFGRMVAIGVEGTGSYGAGLSTASDNPTRLRSEVSFAALFGGQPAVGFCPEAPRDSRALTFRREDL